MHALMWFFFPYQFDEWIQITGSNAANEQQKFLIDGTVNSSVVHVTSLDSGGKIEALVDNDLAQNVD